ncbi:MAG: hypothetical protein JXA77_07855 [Bacteroidales bacterium]|nr:hypothetical protein [Bacteroidales bacterium]MBN2819520.1 hypothetical protein [Bacteroidales bacterium]
MKNLKKHVSALIGIALIAQIFTSCDNKEEVKGEYTNGVYIVNEGNYGSADGSLSFYSYDSDSVYNDIFKAKNGDPLWDVLQSVTTSGDNIYIVVNNSNKIDVADKNTMEYKGSIENVTSPRYLVTKNNTAYVSCWGDNSIKIIDLNTNAIAGTITANGSGPDKMLINNNYLYVVNTGGWGNDSTVTIINTETNEVEKYLNVPYNPKDIVMDNSGNIWVLSFGMVSYAEDFSTISLSPSMLYKIDPATNEVVSQGELFADQHPAHLEANDESNTLYIGGGYTFVGIYKIEIAGNNLTLSQIANDFAYGLNFDAKSNALFVSLSGNYTSAGTVKRYDTDGNLLGTYSCGIGTSGAFKNTK